MNSTLPSILNAYLQESELPNQDPLTASESQAELNDYYRKTVDNDQHRDKLKLKERRKGDGTARKRGKIAKAEKMYELWETVKKRYRDEQLKLYQNKVQLQQQLIKMQAKVIEEKKKMEEDKKYQMTKATHQEGKNIAAKFEDVCLRSLGSIFNTFSDPAYARIKKQVRNRRCLFSKESDNVLLASYKKVLENTEETHIPIIDNDNTDERQPDDVCTNKQDEEVKDMIIDQSTPSYQLHLIDLFGESEARSILYPSFKPIVKKGDNLLLQKYKEASASVSDIWNTLRGEAAVIKRVKKSGLPINAESMERIKRHANQQKDIKKLGLQNGNFSAVGKSSTELDFERPATLANVNVRHSQKKIDLMYRIAKQNEDLTAIMMHNNHTIEFSEDGHTHDNWFTRYQDEEHRKIPESVLQYHTKKSDSSATMNSKMPSLKTEQNIQRRTKTIEETSLVDNKKLVFITPTLKEFLHTASTAKRNVFRTIDGKAINVRNDDRSIRNRPQFNTNRPEIFMKQSKWKSARWQPLSVNALTEYSVSREAPGSGQFSHGRQSMWDVL